MTVRFIQQRRDHKKYLQVNGGLLVLEDCKLSLGQALEHFVSDPSNSLFLNQRYLLANIINAS